MSDDRAFYERRVREELAQAAKESDPRLRQLHEGWADCYRERPNRLRTRADGLGSGLIDQSQKQNVAAMVMADMNVCAQRS